MAPLASDTLTADDRRRQWIALGIGAAAATVALFALSWSLLRANCWIVPLLVAAVAWPLWAYQREQATFGRRVILQAVCTPGGRIRRWFWAGTITRLLRVPAALVWAALLLAVASQFGAWEWTILAADAVLLIALTFAMRRLLAGEVAPAHVGTVSRRWPLLLANTLVLVAAFTAFDYVAGFADTRNLAWSELVDRAVTRGAAAADCSVVGGVIGAVNLSDDLPRHAAMRLLPAMSDPAAKVFAWLVFLGVTGFGGYLFTRLLLGAQVLAEERLPAGLRQSVLVRGDGSFIATAGVVLGGLLLAAHAPTIDWRVLRDPVTDVARYANPCGWQRPQARALQAQAQQRIDAASRAAVDDAMRSVDRMLDAAFDPAKTTGVETYLDWYFSLVGSYTRLGALVIPNLEASMREQFVTRIFGATRFEQKMENLAAAADDTIVQRISGTAQEIARELAARSDAEPCISDVIRSAQLPSLSPDMVRASLSAAVAIPLSRVLVRAAGEAGEAVLARALTRQSVKAATSAAGTAATRRGTSVAMSAGAAALVCAPGGPLALGCSALAAVITWLGVDVAMIAIEEAIFRDRMKQELVAELDAQRIGLRENIRLHLEQTTQLYRLQATRAVNDVFVPARDRAPGTRPARGPI